MATNRIWIAALLVTSSAFATTPHKIAITRSTPWQPSELLIQALELQPNLCATQASKVYASGDPELDESTSRRPKAPLLGPQTATTEEAEAQRLHRIKASRAAADALLTARKLKVPAEYDSVWLDYQTAMALVAADDLELVPKLLGFVIEPTARLYEEQLFARSMLGSPQARLSAVTGAVSEKVCGLEGIAEDLVFPPDLIDLGVGGSLLIYIELKPDRSPGLVWVHASSHSGFEKTALRAVKRNLPKFCESESQAESTFVLLPIVFAFVNESSAKQDAIFDPVYDYTSTKAYRSVDGEGGCDVPKSSSDDHAVN